LPNHDDNWADEFIDEEIKTVLKVRNNGAYLTVDLSAHMEYFYNTLECSNQTPNPFKYPTTYQALQYPVKSKDAPGVNKGSPGIMTRLQVHRLAIFPQLAGTSDKVKGDSATMKSTTDSGDALTPLPKKYTWYPNCKIESPLKQGLIAESPKPKSISSYSRHSSVRVRNDPITPQQQLDKKLDVGLTFSQVSSAMKGGFGTSALTMNKACSLNPQILAMSGPQISMPPPQKKKSILCAVSDFDGSSFM